MRTRRFHVLAFLVFTGCVFTGCNAPTPSEAPVPVDLPTATPPQPAEPPADPLQPLREVDTPESRAAIERLQGLVRLLEDTKNSARDAATTQTDPCRQAFASNVAAQRVSAEIAARHEIPIPRWEVLAEAEYLAACAQLSTELAACARYDVRIDEGERCEGIERAVDEEQRARYRTLVPPRR